MEQLKQVETPFSVSLDDPTGNSFLENPHAPQKDTHLNVDHYRRTAQQEKQLGLVVSSSPGHLIKTHDTLDTKLE